jgi:O-antigen/teichoic acid export membrane protein
LYAIPIISLQAAIFSMSASDKFFFHILPVMAMKQLAFTALQQFCIGDQYFINGIAAIFFSKDLFAAFKKEAGNSVIIRKYFMYYLGIMIAGLILTILFTPLLYHFFIHEKYHPALEYNYLLCIGSFLWGISYFFYSFLLYNKRNEKY